MIDGVLYGSNGIGLVEAFHPGTGKTVWIQQPFADEPDSGLRGNSTRAVAYWTDGSERRLFAIRGEYLVALDPRTGGPVPTWGAGGRVHLKAGLGPRATIYQSSSGPQVCGDVVMVGAQMTDAPQTREQPPGDVQAFDARTGKPRWTFHVIPQPGEVGNETWERDSWAYSGQANLWSLISADEELGLAYLPLTSATNDMYGGHRLGNNLFSGTLVCVKCATGERVWHSQLVHHDLWDYDLPAAPVLADITVDGRRIKAVVQVTKQAFAFVFDRTNGQPVWPIEERPVPRSDTPGERASADAAVSHQTAAVRSAGRLARRSDRFHAGAASGGAAAGEAVPDRSDVHAALYSRRRPGRDEGDDSAARFGRRRRLAGRGVRSRHAGCCMCRRLPVRSWPTSSKAIRSERTSTTCPAGAPIRRARRDSRSSSRRTAGSRPSI